MIRFSIVASRKRVFILGPSHHYNLDGCALSSYTEYATPIGNLPLDLQTIQELRSTGLFTEMNMLSDEEEHSIEMHLPYIRKIFERAEVTIVPILVGSISRSKEATFGACLAPYLREPDTVFVVSSDFCHWGPRFDYRPYYPSPPPATLIRLKRNSKSDISAMYPIHESISALDHEAMSILAGLSADSNVHIAFADYLRRTGNTICGRHPIGILLGALEGQEGNGDGVGLHWVRYEQSSKCLTAEDNSVSYASAYVTL